MADTEEKLGLRVAAVTAVVLLVLFGLYWGGRKLLLAPEEVAPPVEDKDLIVSVEACPAEHRYTELYDAVVDKFEHGKTVCGLEMSNRPYITLTRAISSLDQLVILNVSNIRLEDLPAWIGEMQTLLHLDVSDNALTTLPDELRLLQNLEVLDLRGNPLPPSEVENMRRQLPQTTVHFD